MTTRALPLFLLCAGVVYTAIFASFALFAGGDAFMRAIYHADGGDTTEYVQLARTLLSDQRFALSAGSGPEFFRTPGYPVFIAGVLAIFSTIAVLPFVQVFVVVASAALIVKLGEAHLSRGIGFAAAALYLLDPTTILHTVTALSEVLFVFLLLMGVYMVSVRELTAARSVVAGLSLGALALVRPVGLFILPLIIVYVIYRVWGKRAAVLLVALMLLSSAAVIVPWMARNFDQAGHFSLSSISAYNTLFYNAAEFTAFRTGRPAQSVRDDMYSVLGTDDASELRTFSYVEAERALTREYIAPHVFSYALFHTFKMVPFFVGSSIDSSSQLLYAHGITREKPALDANLSSAVLSLDIGTLLGALRSAPLSVLEQVAWLGMCMLALFGAWYARAKRSVAFVLLCLFLIGAFAALTGPVSMPRYRLPAEPFLFLLGTWGALCLYERYGAAILRRSI